MFMHTVKMASAFVMKAFMERVFEVNASGLEVCLRDASCVYVHPLCGENICLSIILIYYLPKDSDKIHS